MNDYDKECAEHLKCKHFREMENEENDLMMPNFENERTE